MNKNSLNKLLEIPISENISISTLRLLSQSPIGSIVNSRYRVTKKVKDKATILLRVQE